MKMYNISFLACIRFLSSAKEKNKSITLNLTQMGNNLSISKVILKYNIRCPLCTRLFTDLLRFLLIRTDFPKEAGKTKMQLGFTNSWTDKVTCNHEGNYWEVMHGFPKSWCWGSRGHILTPVWQSHMGRPWHPRTCMSFEFPLSWYILGEL